MQETQQHDDDAVDVFIGVDVGKGPASRRCVRSEWQAPVQQSATQRRRQAAHPLAELNTHGRLLFVVDQPSTISALPVAVARAEGVLVAYLPGLAMHRIADLHAGEAKTDARDAEYAALASTGRGAVHHAPRLR